MVELLERVCVEVVQALSASGAGVSVMAGDGVHGMAAASDPSTARIEELPFALGEGPCIDAFASGRPVLVSDLADGATSRWPVYTPAVLDAGIRAVFAFPLQIGAARLGVLDVFRTHPGSLSRAELGQAFTFADLMVMTLLDGQERADVGEFDEMFEHRAELFQAQGMVMVQMGIPLTDALVWIRAHAYVSNRPLSEVAADIVARRLQFGTDHA
ncbi:GAF and ANTAR domain-containing protein [Dactylosporangium fulvum]|uniref:GAF and ANTAR domain-containing protein n=1 Tax=Dactylosporangium fulvum TaxID=53359 RepID=A0ABY5W804_9ACTN|nr:GAF and ANTAR domain-containing protein [Dactylosporangium fulvum]UWP85485.1 GAF and ANTAR domain-containing protein [Dactylosporangium fulvum]